MAIISRYLVLIGKRIRIDGEPTVELDYKSLHIAILYALEGSRPKARSLCHRRRHEDKRPAIKSIFLSAG